LNSTPPRGNTNGLIESSLISPLGVSWAFFVPFGLLGNQYFH
jgi:hypothetical protein